MALCPPRIRRRGLEDLIFENNAGSSIRLVLGKRLKYHMCWREEFRSGAQVTGTENAFRKSEQPPPSVRAVPPNVDRGSFVPVVAA